VRDRPDVDEIEAPLPPPPSLIDGLTDEEWAARRIHREARFRIVFGLLFGLAVGLLAIWHWGLFGVRLHFAASLVVSGSMVLFASLFARRRDQDALDYAGWLALTEWKLFESLPWWLIAALAFVLFAAVFMFVSVWLLARIAFPGA
jgi:hypothetical protein